MVLNFLSGGCMFSEERICRYEPRESLRIRLEIVLHWLSLIFLWRLRPQYFALTACAFCRIIFPFFPSIFSVVNPSVLPLWLIELFIGLTDEQPFSFLYNSSVELPASHFLFCVYMASFMKYLLSFFESVVFFFRPFLWPHGGTRNLIISHFSTSWRCAACAPSCLPRSRGQEQLESRHWSLV